MKKKAVYPTKTSMNLFYKPDRTTKPSTVALYALFAFVCLLGLAKWLVYDLWAERNAAEQALASAQAELNETMLQLADYDEVHLRYVRYAATEEEQQLVDRMEVLAMLDGAIGNAYLNSISISGERVQVQLSNVTLARIAEIVRNLEASPLVAGTVVNTAATARDSYGENWLGETFYSEAGWDLVQANIVIELKTPETEQPEEVQEG